MDAVEKLIQTWMKEAQSFCTVYDVPYCFNTLGGILAFRPREKGAVLLLGLSNSGKTVLFLQLRDKTFKETQASMKQNEDTFEINDPSSKKSAIKRVVDIPGHQRVRYMLRDYLPSASAIVFLVDSVNFEVRPVAEYLYDLFTNKIIRKKKMPILIACNKKDIITAKDCDDIKTAIEREIDSLRNTRKYVPEQHQDDTDDFFLGVEGEQFTMDQIETNKITFAECSAKDGDIQSVAKFILKA